MSRVEQLKATLEEALKPLPEWDEGAGRGTHKWVEAQTPPFTMWETSCVTTSGGSRVDVTPITITRYGPSDPTCSISTVRFKDSSGRSGIGSVGMYLTSEAAALAEADCIMAERKKADAAKRLSKLSLELMPALLRAAENLEYARDLLRDLGHARGGTYEGIVKALEGLK